jgi:ER-bound oxygenase mpaB/B'/Rubber oxygenase, catalytic domain
MGRYDNLHRIEQLDPVRDNGQICRLIAGYEFPWDTTRALEVALFRTFCIPSISKLLDRTGEFRLRTQKRYDDTALIISSIMKWGYDSPQGAEMIQRMNRIHGHFKIGNEDFLYVLSTFIYEPIRWIDRFGWRPLSEKEKLACFYFWNAVGERMQIHEIPPTYEAFERFMLDYERQYLQYSESNRQVGQATLNLFLSWFPSFLNPLLKPCVYALLDNTMLDAFGFSHPPASIRHLVANTLKLRGSVVKMLPARAQPDFYVDQPQRSYPKGYKLTDLGPPHMLDSLNRPSD